MSASNVAEERAKSASASLELPDKNESAMVINERVSRKDTKVHHQCSCLERRKRKVHLFPSSATEARTVTIPCAKPVKTANPIEIQRNALCAPRGRGIIVY